MSLKIVRFERSEDWISVLVEDTKENIQTWMDVWVEDDDLMTDWNKYIFFTEDENDMKEKKYHETDGNFEEVNDIVLEFLNNKKFIIQNDDGSWELKPPKKYKKRKS